MNYNNKTAESNEDKANLFAEFFENVYKEHEDDNSLDLLIQSRNDEHCHNIVITENNVKAVLYRMDLNKGSGFDGVASIFLRECSDHYPKAFKIGILTPIYKSGSKKNIENYRGVNTVPNIAKVFDKVIYEQLKLIFTPFPT